MLTNVDPTARELRAEARAWRRAAEMHDGLPGSPSMRIMVFETPSMMQRWCRHEIEMLGGLRRWAVILPMIDSVLACLLLALECEDEACTAPLVW